MLLMLSSCYLETAENSNARRAVIETKDNRHFSIFGSALLKVVDDNRIAHYCRSGRLAINDLGKLCLILNSKLCVIEPAVTLPVEQSFDIHNSLIVSPIGEVKVLNRPEGIVITCGSLVPFKFPDGALHGSRLGSATFPAPSFPPTQVSFGGEPGDFILQGWIESGLPGP